MFGYSGVDSFKEELFQFGQEKFTAWKFWRGVDMYDHIDNFGTVEILRWAQGLGYYER